jgi:hypothetical protein
MKHRINCIARKLTVAAIIAGLTTWLPLPAWQRPSASAQTTAGTAAAPPALQGEQAVKQLKEQGLYDSLEEAVDAARYELRWEERPALRGLPAAYHAPNPEQRLSAYFTPSGLQLAPHKSETEAESQTAAQAEWQMKMSLIGYGYGERLLPVEEADLVARGNRLEYHRAWLPLTEWYVNKAGGLEQGFTLAAAPAARAEGEQLRLELEVRGSLHAELAGEGQTIALKQADGELALRYSGLHADDAQGRELPSKMKVSEGRIILEVDDEKAIYPVTIDPTFTQQAKLIASDGGRGDRFGSSIAIYGDMVVVGAPDDGIGANDIRGSAYVFVRSNGAWSQQAKLIASDGAALDQFGSSVAISGNTIVVGAPSDDIGTNAGQGSAYVFVPWLSPIWGTVWIQQAKLTSNDGAAWDKFGSSVGISVDSVVTGAPGDNIGANADQGSAYVFSRNNGSWPQQAKLIASDGAAGDEFGHSIAIAGNTIVIGAPSGMGDRVADQGSAYVFGLSNGYWSEWQKLTASDGWFSDGFGHSVAISSTGNRIVVGAPYKGEFSPAYIDYVSRIGSAYVFLREYGLNYHQLAILTSGRRERGAEFGRSVAISGYDVVVGAPGSDGYRGSVHLFTCNNSCGTPQALSASNWEGGNFGSSVGISGNTVVAGARAHNIGANYYQGSAYVFTR